MALFTDKIRFTANFAYKIIDALDFASVALLLGAGIKEFKGVDSMKINAIAIKGRIS